MLILMTALQGCTASPAQEKEGSLQVGEYLYEALGDEKLAGIGDELPECIRVISDDNGLREIANLTDTEEIAAAAELFKAVQIGKKTDIYVTDRYNSVSFTFADGEKTVITLNDRNLEWKNNDTTELYELEGMNDFWKSIFQD